MTNHTLATSRQFFPPAAETISPQEHPAQAGSKEVSEVPRDEAEEEHVTVDTPKLPSVPTTDPADLNHADKT